MTPKEQDRLYYRVVWIILNSVKSIQGGKHRLALFLKGSNSKQISHISNRQGFGGLMWFDIPAIEGFIEQLEHIGLIKRKELSAISNYTIFELTEAGDRVLQKKELIPLQLIKNKKQYTLNDSDLITLEHIKEGKNISETARLRNLAISTVYHHVYKLIMNNRLLKSDIFDEELIKKVVVQAQKIENPTVSKLKEVLPNLSYDEIRCALAKIEKKSRRKE
jgi:DNA-binding CsgD family transcriptional regulator